MPHNTNGAASQEVTHSAVAVYRFDYTRLQPKAQLTKMTILTRRPLCFLGQTH